MRNIYIYKEEGKRGAVSYMCVCWRPRLNASIEFISPFLSFFFSFPAGRFLIWYTVLIISSTLRQYIISLRVLRPLMVGDFLSRTTGNIWNVTFRSWAFFSFCLDCLSSDIWKVSNEKAAHAVAFNEKWNNIQVLGWDGTIWTKINLEIRRGMPMRKETHICRFSMFVSVDTYCQSHTRMDICFFLKKTVTWWTQDAAKWLLRGETHT